MSQLVVVLIGNWERGSCPMGVIVLQGNCPQLNCPKCSCSGGGGIIVLGAVFLEPLLSYVCKTIQISSAIKYFHYFLT